MIGPQDIAVSNAAPRPDGKVMRMVRNDRTAGFIASWENIETATQQIEKNLSAAKNAGTAHEAGKPYAYQEQIRAVPQEEEFGFGDLLDMVNPLHHIPLVGHIYREITGDMIKPIGQIIGGAVFGGAVGAAGGLVTVVAEHEFGKNMNGVKTAFSSNQASAAYEAAALTKTVNGKTYVSASSGRTAGMILRR